MSLSDRHRRFLLVEQGLGPAVFNCAINGAIAWAMFRSAADVPIWGEQSVGVDLLATAFILPLLTCVIVSALVGRQVRSGKVSPLAPDQLPHSSWFERSVPKRALLLATAGVLFGAAPIVLALSLGQAQAFTVPAFVVFKALWSALLAAAVTPISGWWALASASHTQTT